MVVCKTLWLVGFGVPDGWVDSVLCEHHYEQFLIRLFASLDGIRCALRLPIRRSLFPLLESQLLDLPPKIREVGAILYLQPLRGCMRPG